MDMTIEGTLDTRFSEAAEPVSWQQAMPNGSPAATR
jgi:hypothetical protein